MNVSSNLTAASLMSKAAKVRSYYADPVNKLGNERSQQEDVCRQLREQGDSFFYSASHLEQAQASVRMLGKMWSEGKLPALQEAAIQLAERSAGNPLASIALGTRQMLGELFGEKSSSEDAALEGAVVLAGSLGDEPSRYASGLNQGLRKAYDGLPEGVALEGPVDPIALFHFSEKLGQESQLSDQAANEKYQEANVQWLAVETIQDQLNVHFRGRRKGQGLHFAEKKAAAQEFVADLKAASQSNPEIIREMRALAKETQSPMAYDPSGILSSYDAQVAKSGNVDWSKIVRQFERTSFGN